MESTEDLKYQLDSVVASHDSLERLFFFKIDSLETKDSLAKQNFEKTLIEVFHLDTLSGSAID